MMKVSFLKVQCPKEIGFFYIRTIPRDEEKNYC